MSFFSLPAVDNFEKVPKFALHIIRVRRIRTYYFPKLYVQFSPPGFVEFCFFFLLLTGRNSLLKVLPLSEGFPHEAGVWARRAKYWSRNGVLRDEHKPRPRRLSSFLSSRLYYDPWNRDGGRLKHKLYANNNLKATQYSLMTRFNIQYLTVIFCYSDTFVQ